MPLTKLMFYGCTGISVKNCLKDFKIESIDAINRVEDENESLLTLLPPVTAPSHSKLLPPLSSSCSSSTDDGIDDTHINFPSAHLPPNTSKTLLETGTFLQSSVHYSWEDNYENYNFINILKILVPVLKDNSV